MLTPEEIARRGTFLVREVGSTAHGTNLRNDGDLDLSGVCFQPPEYLLGLQRFEQYNYRTAEERARHDPESDQRYAGRTPQSQPGDLDLTVYSVQKFLRLALSGNPSVLVLLYSQLRHPEYESEFKTYYGHWARGFDLLAPSIASKIAGTKFLGYLKAQKERMLGMRGQMRVTRIDLINKFGYDCKYAMQAIRLGLQGIEYMQTGRLQLPMTEAVADSLKEVRRGELLLAEVIEWIENLDDELKTAIDNSALPKQPRYQAIDAWLEEAQLEFFSWYRSQTW